MTTPMYLSGGASRRRRRQWGPGLGTLLFVALLIGVNYFVFLRDDGGLEAPALEQQLQHKASPPPSSAPATQPQQVPVVPRQPVTEEEGAVLAGAIERGETVLSAATALGVDAPAMFPVVHAMESVFDFRKSRVGDQWTLRVDGSGRIAKFEYETSPLDKYVVSLNEEGDYDAVKKAVPIEVQTAEIGCGVQTSLYGSLKKCGEDGALANQLVDLLAWDIDFFQDVRKGDELRLIVEKKFVDGKFYAYGRLLAAEYRGKVGTHRVFWHEDPDHDIAGYYTESGKAVKKEFLKTPLKFTRVSSGYTHHRFHPVLHRYKKHLGIDYAAAVGTPVWAVANGTVTFVGAKGASGNLVAVSHANGYTSYYAHLSKFAKDLEVGDRVDQKQVIGYVGTTGRSTGPHLHFGLKHNGRFINPLQVKFTTDNPIPADALPKFQQEVDKRTQEFERITVTGADGQKA
jgi:murein DD-endopeptidase MepM/ murein hydrolase activator NlpD